MVRVVAQRVSSASVDAEGRAIADIGKGIVALVGVAATDAEEDAAKLADKLANLRIFADAEGKMNLSLLQVGGEALVVSQFTLYADCRKGRRPSFAGAAEPARAEKLYALFAQRLRELGVKVRVGVFGAKMQVRLVNDGPVTLILESEGAPEREEIACTSKDL